MIQRDGTVLKRCVEIRLGKVPGVACFGEEAEVAEGKPLDHIYLDLQMV